MADVRTDYRMIVSTIEPHGACSFWIAVVTLTDAAKDMAGAAEAVGESESDAVEKAVRKVFARRRS